VSDDRSDHSEQPGPEVPSQRLGPERADGPRHRLDPERAASTAGTTPASAPPAIDTRRYRWTIGIFGLTLLIAAVVYDFVNHTAGSPGVAAGKRMHFFVAPLATAKLDKDANTSPRCDQAHPNPEGLNVCGRTPLVITFFVTGSGTCKRQVDTLQRVSREFSPSAAVFAAVAVRASRSETDALVRSHHWTIPVAYDRDGAIGALYGVEICPMIELARPGGVVAEQLIGEHWLTAPALSARVRALLGR
jgi:AhpC/TSA family